MFRPGLASKPWLWPGFRRLRLSGSPGRAKAPTDGLAWAWPGPSRGLSTQIYTQMNNKYQNIIYAHGTELEVHKANLLVNLKIQFYIILILVQKQGLPTLLFIITLARLLIRIHFNFKSVEFFS